MTKKTLALAALLATMSFSAFAAPAVDSMQDVAMPSALVAEVASPDAEAYAKGSQVKVEAKMLETDSVRIAYPRITAQNVAAEKAINQAIEKSVQELAKQGKVISTYDIKADGKGIFSYIMTIEPMNEPVADLHPEVRGFTFDTMTGNMLRIEDFGPYDAGKLNHAISHNPHFSNIVDKAFMGFDVLPKEFYVNEDRVVYSIIEEGTIAPASEGTLFVPMMGF